MPFHRYLLSVRVNAGPVSARSRVMCKSLTCANNYFHDLKKSLLKNSIMNIVYSQVVGAPSEFPINKPLV
jgi:hypothetical protein